MPKKNVPDGGATYFQPRFKGQQSLLPEHYERRMMQAPEVSPQIEKLRSHFLYRHGVGFVQLVVIVSIVGNAMAAVTYFHDDKFLLCAWAIPATVLLPRAVFAICLIRERRGLLYGNLSRFLTTFYRGTFLRYHPENFMLRTVVSGKSARRAYIREAAQIILWLVPLVVFINWPGVRLSAGEPMEMRENTRLDEADRGYL